MLDNPFIKELYRRLPKDKGRAGAPNSIGFDAYFGVPVIEKERCIIHARFGNFCVNGCEVGSVVELNLPASPEVGDTFFFEGGRRVHKLVHDKSGKLIEIEIHPNE